MTSHVTVRFQRLVKRLNRGSPLSELEYTVDRIKRVLDDFVEEFAAIFGICQGAYLSTLEIVSNRSNRGPQFSDFPQH